MAIFSPAGQTETGKIMRALNGLTAGLATGSLLLAMNVSPTLGATAGLPPFSAPAAPLPLVAQDGGEADPVIRLAQEQAPAEAPADGDAPVAAGNVDDSVASERNPEDNWLKVCDTLESGELACIMRQIVIRGGQFSGSFTIRNDPSQDRRLQAVAAVPLGVLLVANMVWQIDGGQPSRQPFWTCDPRSCVSVAFLNEEYINSLKRGAKLFLKVKNLRNEDLVVEIDLAGFTAVWEGDEYLSIDEFQAQESGQTALEQLLQDRAEQVRQEREQGGQGN